MSEEKKTWQKPQLIVLGRGRPEEQVLAVCKNQNVGYAGGPNTNECRTHPTQGACNAPGQT